MADTKVSDLPTLTTPANEDLLYVIDNPSGTPASKNIDLATLFGNIAWNVSVIGAGQFSVNGSVSITNSSATFTSNVSTNVLSASSFTVANTGFRFGAAYTPANSKITVTQGTMFFDANYLYIATANNNLKRITLNSF